MRFVLAGSFCNYQSVEVVVFPVGVEKEHPAALFLRGSSGLKIYRYTSRISIIRAASHRLKYVQTFLYELLRSAMYRHEEVSVCVMNVCGLDVIGSPSLYRPVPSSLTHLQALCLREKSRACSELCLARLSSPRPGVNRAWEPAGADRLTDSGLW